MNLICGIIGLVIGIVLFVLFLDKLHFIFTSFYSLMLIFTVCVGIGCALAYFLGWIFIILAVIFVIYLIFFNDDDKDKKNDNSTNDNQQGNQTINQDVNQESK